MIVLRLLIALIAATLCQWVSHGMLSAGFEKAGASVWPALPLSLGFAALALIRTIRADDWKPAIGRGMVSTGETLMASAALAVPAAIIPAMLADYGSSPRTFAVILLVCLLGWMFFAMISGVLMFSALRIGREPDMLPGLVRGWMVRGDRWLGR